MMAHSPNSRPTGTPGACVRITAHRLFGEILAAAPGSEVDPGVDPDNVFELLVGALLTRALLATTTSVRKPLARLVDVATRVLRRS